MSQAFTAPTFSDSRRKRLHYRAWHRGTREMDLLLGSFADQNLAGFDEAALTAFAQLLDETDPDLYDWITRASPLPARLNAQILEKLLNHQFVP